MMRVLKPTAIILFAGLLCGVSAKSSGTSAQAVQSYGLPEYHRDVARILKYVRPALRSPIGLRLSYAAACGPGINIPPIPDIHLQQPTGSNSNLDTVRTVFRSDSNVVVSSGPEGVIEIGIGKIPDTLLRTRLQVLKLQPIEQFNPSAAIAAVKNTPEVQAAIRTLGLRSSSDFHIRLLRSPESGGPHLPAVMNDVTIDHILDLLAERFKVLVAYGVCRNRDASRRFFMDVVDLTQH